MVRFKSKDKKTFVIIKRFYFLSKLKMQEVHSYYFAVSGRFFGLVPHTCEIVCLGTPVAFNASTRVLSYNESQRVKQVILPLDKAEQSKNPNLCERTKVMLSQLALASSAAAAAAAASEAH